MYKDDRDGIPYKYIYLENIFESDNSVWSI